MRKSCPVRAPFAPKTALSPSFLEGDKIGMSAWTCQDEPRCTQLQYSSRFNTTTRGLLRWSLEVVNSKVLTVVGTLPGSRLQEPRFTDTTG